MADDDLDDTIGGFVELEDELTSGSAAAGTYHDGTVSGGTKVSVADVPDDYPATFDTDHALHLEVDVDDGATVDAFLPWPEPGSDSDHVTRLLDNLGLGADEFANIYGEAVALEPVEGWHRVDVDASPPSGSHGRGDAGGSFDSPAFGSDTTSFGSDTSGTDTSPFESDSTTPEYYGEDDTTIAAVVVPAIAVATGGLTLFAAGISNADSVSTLVAVLWGLSLLAIPVALAYSAYVTDERGGWDPHPVVWGVGGLVPFLNVPVGMGYVVEWLARGKPRAGPSRLWFWGVVVATVLSLGFLPPLFGGASSAQTLADPLEYGAVTAWIYSYVLLPMAIFFDSRHVDEGGDWDPTRVVWVGGAVAASMLLFLGWFVGAVYLLKRHLELG